MMTPELVCDGCGEGIDNGLMVVYEGGDLVFHEGCDIGEVEELVKDPSVVEKRPVWHTSTNISKTLHARPDCPHLNKQGVEKVKKRESMFWDHTNRCGHCWPEADDGDD